MAYSSGWGVHGLWTGLVAAMVVLNLGQYAHMARVVNWWVAARKARERALEQRPARGGGGGGGVSGGGDHPGAPPPKSDSHALCESDGYEANGKQLAMELGNAHGKRVQS